MGFPAQPEWPVDEAEYDVAAPDVMEYTGLSDAVFRSWLSSGQLPYMVKGRVRYLPDAHVKWLKKFLEAHIQLSDAERKYGVSRATLRGRWARGKLAGLKVKGTIYLEESGIIVTASGTLISTSKVAEILGLKHRAAYRLYERGQLVSYRGNGGRHKFLLSDVMALKEKRAAQRRRRRRRARPR